MRVNGYDARMTVRRYAGATGRDLHIDTPLSNLTIAYRPMNLIADQIYPVVPVDKETGIYYVWNQAEMLRAPNAHRARGTAANKIGYAVSSETYVARNYALAADIPLEDLANADEALELRSSVSMMLVDKLNLSWEKRIATTLTTTTNMASSTSLTNRWSDLINGTPVEDLFTGIEAIRQGSGFKPNKLIFSGQAWNNFAKHPDVIAFIRGTGDNVGGGRVTEQQVASAFRLSQVLIGEGIENTADEDAPGTYTDIWSTAAVLLYVAPAPGRMVASHGYTFRWTPPGFPGLPAVGRFEQTERHVEVLETHHFQDEKVTGTPLGYLIVNA